MSDSSRERVTDKYDQPLPKEGKQIVMPALREEFDQLADLRYKVGIERYGTALKTFNGRDAGKDAVEEWFDLGIYLKQLRMQYDVLQAENVLLRQYAAYLTGFAQRADRTERNEILGFSDWVATLNIKQP